MSTNYYAAPAAGRHPPPIMITKPMEQSALIINIAAPAANRRPPCKRIARGAHSGVAHQGRQAGATPAPPASRRRRRRRRPLRMVAAARTPP
eukprot:4802851-Prymnesium_polylepis.1